MNLPKTRTMGAAYVSGRCRFASHRRLPAFYQGADLLIAADCTAYAYGRFHQDFIRNRIVLIGCPKLDDTDYSLKLTDILAKNEIRSVTVVRMEVPCCGGISYAAEKAVARCGKKLPMQIITIGTDGEICR